MNNKYLRKNRKKMNPNKLLIRSCEFKYLKGIETALKRGANIHCIDDIAIAWTTFNGDFESTKYLLKHHSNIHSNDNRVLKYSLTFKNFDIFKILFEYDININDNLKTLIYYFNDIFLFKTSIDEFHYKLIDYLFNINFFNDDVINKLYDSEIKNIIKQKNRFIKIKSINN